MVTTLSPELVEALDEGGVVLSTAQQKQLAEHEASLLGMTLPQAAARVTNGGLPRTPVGYELTDLIRHLRLA